MLFFHDATITKPDTANVYAQHRQFLINHYHLPYDLEEVTKKRQAITQNILIPRIVYKPDAYEVLQTLKQRGYRLVLATMTAKKLLQKYQNLDLSVFDLILTTDDITEPKPSPQIYLQAMQQLSATPTECLVVEDSLEGVTAGKNANIDVLNVIDHNAQHQQKEIDKLADYQMRNFNEFLSVLNAKNPTNPSTKQ